MNLYLDTEFNGHGGELISLALAAQDGEHFYGVSSWPRHPHEWVAEHVLPVVGSPLIQPSDFRHALRNFLLRRRGASIYADWPDDFAHFLRCLSGPSFDQSLDYQCTMHLIKTPPGEPKPEIPHNALSDAIALMHWHQRGSA